MKVNTGREETIRERKEGIDSIQSPLFIMRSLFGVSLIL